MNDHVLKLEPVSLSHIVVTPDQVTEAQLEAYFVRNNVDRDFEQVLRSYSDRMAAIRAEIARDMQQQERTHAAFQHLATHGRIVKIVCFGCGIHYESWDKKPPVCPSCGANNLDF